MMIVLCKIENAVKKLAICKNTFIDMPLIMTFVYAIFRIYSKVIGGKREGIYESTDFEHDRRTGA
ncbi:MAG: hypothetical protein RR234_05270 [Christensenella sp.]